MICQESVKRVLGSNLRDDLLCGLNTGLFVQDDKRDGLCNLVHILFIEASGRGGRGSETDTAGHEGRTLLVGDSVLVGSDMCLVKPLLDFLTCEILLCEVNEHQVVVSARVFDS